jgi:hypothetical protein
MGIDARDNQGESRRIYFWNPTTAAAPATPTQPINSGRSRRREHCEWEAAEAASPALVRLLPV